MKVKSLIMARLPGIASLLRRIYGSIYYTGALELFSHTSHLLSAQICINQGQQLGNIDHLFYTF